MPVGVPHLPAGAVGAAPVVPPPVPAPAAPAGSVPPAVQAPGGQTYADLVTRVAEAPHPAVAGAPGSEKPHPAPPSRHLPQPIAADGTPMTLPPLPDETAAALAHDERADISTEPRPSPQSRA